MKSKSPNEEELAAQTGENPSPAETSPYVESESPASDVNPPITPTNATAQLPPQQEEPKLEPTTSTAATFAPFNPGETTSPINTSDESLNTNSTLTSTTLPETPPSSELLKQDDRASPTASNDFSPFGDPTSMKSEPKSTEPDPFATSPVAVAENPISPPFSPPNVVAETFPTQPMPAPETAVAKTPSELVPTPIEPAQPAVLPMEEPQPFSPGRVPVEINATPPQSYIVKDGDNFWEISKKVYGQHSLFLALFEFNRSRVPNADLLIPGTELLTPDQKQLEEIANQLATSTRVAKANTSVSTANTTIVRRPETPLSARESGIFYRETDGQPIYRVGKNDSLTRIALQHLGRSERWRQIYNMNQDQLKSEKDLRPGVELRLPADASRVALTDDTSFRR